MMLCSDSTNFVFSMYRDLQYGAFQTPMEKLRDKTQLARNQERKSLATSFTIFQQQRTVSENLKKNLQSHVPKKRVVRNMLFVMFGVPDLLFKQWKKNGFAFSVTTCTNELYLASRNSSKTTLT